MYGENENNESSYILKSRWKTFMKIIGQFTITMPTQSCSCFINSTDKTSELFKWQTENDTAGSSHKLL
jgi:hypothetical protein